MSELGELIYYDAEIEATQTNIRNLMESTGWSAKDVMEKFKIPEEEQRRYEESFIKKIIKSMRK